ncbi:hypothetical protein [Epilithonimonas lactis]|uniref:Uncharacterized protein n=1 Tax=Epilithonimonas lactis TaxID=421072 RepID=A0A085BHK9_9FLAO|nr:hypothetical protein [Epilithonimonas lactis]KFC21954.1 hypothetical protein IO89_08255 [Epilithonimonas lactis]SEQ49950.1 hypothetical protein SAMN04488097_2263 [Epilithonimonas lactis]
MPITNLNNNHLSAAQVTAAKDAVTALESALSTINVSLTPDDRQKYGSINEQNKLLVNKVNDFHQNQPQLDTDQVDWDEFADDYASRLLMENIINRLASLMKRLENAKILHDYDNYQASLTDYGYTSFMAGTGAPGFETKMEELKQFFLKPAPKDKPVYPKV